jgi:ankyrin repeat protein
MKKLIIIFIILIPLFSWGITPEERESHKHFMVIQKALEDIELLKFYIDDGLDVNILDKNDNTLLMKVCGDISQDIDVIQYLIDEGIEIDIISSSGHTALSIAMKKGNVQVIKLLLDNDADWTISEKANIININDLETVKYFVNENIDVNYQDKNGLTALMRASLNDNYELTEYLLSNGADAGLENIDNKTAIDYAYEKKLYDIIKILKEYTVE